MSEYIDPLSRAAILRWLRSLGVLCDCSDGWRQFPPPGGAEKCSRCTLVEVGGIRLRWLRDLIRQDHTTPDGKGWPSLWPVVVVTDE